MVHLSGIDLVSWCTYLTTCGKLLGPLVAQYVMQGDDLQYIRVALSD